MESIKNLYAEVRCDYLDESDGFWRVDAWKTDDDNEEGRVIALIDSLTARVVYIDNAARGDEMVEEVIADKVTELNYERIRVRDEQGTLTVYFKTKVGTLVGQLEKSEDVGTDNFYVGLEPCEFSDDYIDLVGVRVQEDEKGSFPGKSGVKLYAFGDPAREDPTTEEIVFSSDIEEALAEYHKED